MIKRLLNRMNVKVQKLITQYEPDPEKFMAVFSVAARVWRQSSVFMEAPSVSTFQGWAEKAREHYMNKLTKGHEYKAFGAALEFDRICTVLNGKAISYLQQIIDSMNFRVSFEGKVVDQNNAGTETWSSQGEAKDIRWGGDLRNGKYLHLCGAGEGKHVEFSTTANVTHNSTHEKDFTFSVDVFPDPCDTGKVKVEIERFGPDALTYIDCETGGEVELASMYSYMWIMLDIFSKTDSGFLVVMDMADGVAEFEGTLEGTYGTGKINYTIKLQHTPK
ncbi:MAG: hypothetical protein PHG06_11335 [Parabacteroides sp.]|nr:hypothetical protein [Parabacteroides sp.]